MKLLLDEMWPPAASEQLRQRGIDAVGVAERPDLAGKADGEIFMAAQSEERAVVTENARDYLPLATAVLHHSGTYWGLVLTSNRGYPRHDPRTLGHLITALAALAEARGDLRNTEHWL